MRFIARKEFRWDGRLYEKGDDIEIPEGHPRIGGMIQGRFITYDQSVGSAPKPVKDEPAQIEVTL